MGAIWENKETRCCSRSSSCVTRSSTYTSLQKPNVCMWECVGTVGVYGGLVADGGHMYDTVGGFLSRLWTVRHRMGTVCLLFSLLPQPNWTSRYWTRCCGRSTKCFFLWYYFQQTFEGQERPLSAWREPMTKSSPGLKTTGCNDTQLSPSIALYCKFTYFLWFKTEKT